VSAAESFWAKLPLGRGVEVIASDANGLAALNKPAGGLSHPNEARDRVRSLLVADYDAQTESFGWEEDGEGAGGRLWLLNRLDSATSGVILVASDEALAKEIRAQFKRKQVTKIYQALVFGKPMRAAEVWRDLLAVQKAGGRIRTSASAGNVPAECAMKLVATRAGADVLSLLQLEPRTGRSHQLRVQCAKRRLPIVGDQTYGDFGHNRAFAKRTGEKRLFLHSMETRFRYDWKGRTFDFAARAELPEAFRAAVGRG